MLMNYNVSLGVDVGSMTTKLVALADGNVLGAIYKNNEPGLGSVPNCESYSCGTCKKGCSTGSVLKTVDEFVDDLKGKYPDLGDVDACVITGSQMDNPEIKRKLNGKFPTIYLTEITTHLKGYDFLHPNRPEKAILDIGGQDTKIITSRVKEIQYNGRRNVIDVDYGTNNKCAGTAGAFIESSAEFLGIPIEEFGKLAMKGFPKIRGQGDIVSSRCATFARENLTKLQRYFDKEQLAAATCKSLAQRTGALVLPKIGKDYREVIFQGGVASNEGMVHSLSDVLKRKIKVPAHEDMEVGAHKVMGALGAAYLAERDGNRIRQLCGYRFMERPKYEEETVPAGLAAAKAEEV
jgi:activator of 2-hydroxyglutaryl-CoA dehydratase